MTDQIVRTEGVLDYARWKELGGDAGMTEFEGNIIDEALARAKHIGITRPHVRSPLDVLLR